jgi:hypothetical protein
MWLIGKTVNWANWDPAGRSTGCPVCGEQSSGFASLPFRISPALRWTLPRFRRSEGKPGFPETRPRKFGAGLGQAAEPGRTFRSVNTRASSIKTSQ